MWSPSVNLKFCLLNAENLFLLFDAPPSKDLLQSSELAWQKHSTSTIENKSLRKCQALAKTLTEIDADIVMLCEVGGIESLQNFNHLFLNETYSPALLEGNSDRNIDVGFLIRKGSPFYFDLLSNKSRSINYLYPHERESMAQGYPLKIQSHRFSRDAVELKLFQADRENPFLVVLLTHLKSRLDKDRIDPAGFERRQAELKTLVDIYQELESKYPKAPKIVAGDFNGNASALETDEEFRPLYNRTSLKDVLELDQLSAGDRWTFCQIRSGSRSEGRQIDFAFLDPKAQSHLKAGSARVVRYKNERGLEIEPPQSLDAKFLLPSDHYPVVFELENLQAF